MPDSVVSSLIFSAEQPDLILARIDGTLENPCSNYFLMMQASPCKQEKFTSLIRFGNLMMSYKPGADARDLLEDLKKLLSLSQYG